MRQLAERDRADDQRLALDEGEELARLGERDPTTRRLSVRNDVCDRSAVPRHGERLPGLDPNVEQLVLALIAT
ncbi:hypothetical protein [Pseudonocardia sp. N23]|uniref:hypothetical protein n=1 Tax=Pseudonocardia sp. N23 TaxID=1987376 RepID=UPI001145A29F|nr:hypothetical protein [Pseudonocardia sp. N23]